MESALGRFIELRHIQLDESLGQCRPAIVDLGGGETGLLAVYSRNGNLDPWQEAYTFPKDTLKISMTDSGGGILWTRNLGAGTSPGIWFCPVLPFDINGDGVDEIFFVQNYNFHLPFSIKNTKLVCVDARRGTILGEWPWNYECGENHSHSYVFRNCLIGGSVRGEPVLVCTRGTYEDMYFEAYGRDMKPLWKKAILKEEPGCRASHQCLVVDINQDGVDELMWGERCLSLEDGRELFCADRDTWRHHSDLVLPVWDEGKKEWFLFTCREGDIDVGPRNCLYDSRGRRIWGHVDHGHMHVNWFARTPDYPRGLAYSLKIEYHETRAGVGGVLIEPEPHFFDMAGGKELGRLFDIDRVGYRSFEVAPVDVNGDGFHEFYRNGEILDSRFNLVAEIRGEATQLMAHISDEFQGEQIVTFTAEGALGIWGDREAHDTAAARKRYATDYYRKNRKNSAVGYNRMNLVGV